MNNYTELIGGLIAVLIFPWLLKYFNCFVWVLK